jgi:hypothetical protein
MTEEPIDRLERICLSADSMPDKPLTVTATLCEVYRISKRGFTDSEATYWAERLENLMADCSAR